MGVNYYEHHIGDFDSATAHLSLVEDAVYRRLICLYYRSESPIPADVKQACRLVRAVSKAERDTVADVLREFFSLEADGWHNTRCDEEIARFQDKQRKARASADARWSKGQTHTERNANASPDAMRTHSEGNADGMHRAPVPSLQTPDTRPKDKGGELSITVAPGQQLPPDPPGDAAPTPPAPSLAGRACVACRGANVHDVNPSHPDLLRLLAAGVTPEEIGATAAECAGKGKARFAYVLATVERRRVETAAKPAAAALQADPMAWADSRRDVIATALRLGLEPFEELNRSTGHANSWSAYRNRVIAAWQAQHQGAAA